jgi:tetratricopeptide (TPR) repeat protein
MGVKMGELTELSNSEIIRRQMQNARSNLQSVQSIPSAEKEKLILEKDAHTEEILFQNGYSLVKKFIEQNTVDGMFLSKEDPSLNPIKVEDFIINQEKLNIDFWKNHVKTPTSLQEVFNYSDDMVIHIYNIGLHFFEEKEYQKAIDVFEFLCMLDSNISSFWIAKGLAFEGNNELAKAMNVFEKSIKLFPSTFGVYIGMIRCSEKAGDFTRVKELLVNASGDPALKEQAEEALEYIRTAKQGV